MFSYTLHSIGALSILLYLTIQCTANVNDCGSRFQVPRIFGGSFAYNGEFPWAAKIDIAYSDSRILLCGATLIDDQWLLTAAHCLDGNIIMIRITLGRTDFADPQEETHQQQFVTKDFFIHPQYNGTNMKFDFALIRISRPVVLNRYVQKICLPNQSSCNYDKDTSVVDGCDSGLAAGWGLTESNSISKILKQAELPLMPLNQCRSLETYRNDNMGEERLCAGGANDVDACDGDSGGPLICLKAEQSERAVLLGVVSYGGSCGSAGVPGIYARVCSALDWIQRIINLTRIKSTSNPLTWISATTAKPRLCQIPKFGGHNSADILANSLNWVEPGQKVKIFCDNDYRFSDGTLFIELACGSDIEWQPKFDKNLTCLPVIYCYESQLPYIPNGQVITLNDDPEEKVDVFSKRSVYCDINPANILDHVECGEDGNWTYPMFANCPEVSTTPRPTMEQVEFWKTSRIGDLSGFKSSVYKAVNINWRNPDKICTDSDTCISNSTALSAVMNNCQNLTANEKSQNVTIDITNLLMSHGADIESANNFDETPLMDAARHCNGTNIAKLLLEHGANVNAENLDNFPLAIAASKGELDLVALLLDYGADVNHQESMHGETALIRATKENKLATVQLLLNRGATVNLKSPEEMSALEYSLHFGYLDIARLLLSFGADKEDCEKMNYPFCA